MSHLSFVRIVMIYCINWIDEYLFFESTLFGQHFCIFLFVFIMVVRQQSPNLRIMSLINSFFVNPVSKSFNTFCFKYLLHSCKSLFQLPIIFYFPNELYFLRNPFLWRNLFIFKVHWRNHLLFWVKLWILSWLFWVFPCWHDFGLKSLMFKSLKSFFHIIHSLLTNWILYFKLTYNLLIKSKWFKNPCEVFFVNKICLCF